MLQIIWDLRVFTQISVLQDAGGVTSETNVLGTYIYADYQSPRFFRFRIVNGAIADRTEITDQLRPAGNAQFGGIASFGSDNAGEMYVATFTPGVVYKVAAAP